MKFKVLKTSLLLMVTMVIGLSSAIAEKPYFYPFVKDLSQDNWNHVEFARTTPPIRIEGREDYKNGDILMVHDRYQTVFIKKNGKFKKVGYLARLDKILVLDNDPAIGGKKLKIKVLRTVDPTVTKYDEIYVRYTGLSTYQDYQGFDSDVFMIQNIATEKLRVYHRPCKDFSCPPQLLLQVDMVASSKKFNKKHPKRRTRLGHYRLFEWNKFYQDRKGGHYPSWYDPKYPPMPSPRSNWSPWLSKESMPWKSCERVRDGKGRKVTSSNCSYKGMGRGAFGWYTALVEPNRSLDQWTHGTIGWGEQSAKMIALAKGKGFWGVLGSIFKSYRSSGCTRVDNQTIAFLRHILPEGTPIIKIYALEKLQNEASRDAYFHPKRKYQWNYVLTKNGVRATGEDAESAHFNSIFDLVGRKNDILERGTYKFSSYPTVVQYKDYGSWGGDEYGSSNNNGVCEISKTDKYSVSRENKILSDGETLPSKLPDTCNLFRIKTKFFKGVFYVDTGLLDGYNHPKAPNIFVGGYKEEKFPSYVLYKKYRK